MKTSLGLLSKSTRAIILIALFACYPAFAQGNGAQEKSRKIDELMSLYASRGQFNGTVLVAERGQVIFKKGYGMANIEWDIPNTPDVKFRLGSITKQFTAVLILQLVEAGKVKLDGKITDYLPDYRKEVVG